MNSKSFRALAGAVLFSAAATAGSASAGGPPGAPAAGASLTVAFDSLESKDGQVMVALFDSQAGYDASTPLRGAMTSAAAEPVRVVFAGLPPGRYALKVFHDLNGNGKLDVNPFGMPREPYAFSNNAQGMMGPPGWADAAFDLGPDGAVQTLHLR